MEENKKKDQDQDQSQGKQSTAETDVNYILDNEKLRNSATTSMPDVDSGGSIGSGGGRVEAVRDDGTDAASGS